MPLPAYPTTAVIRDSLAGQPEQPFLMTASMLVAAFRICAMQHYVFVSTNSVNDLWISMWMKVQAVSQTRLPPRRLLIRQIFINHINKVRRICS